MYNNKDNFLHKTLKINKCEHYHFNASCYSLMFNSQLFIDGIIKFIKKKMNGYYKVMLAYFDWKPDLLLTSLVEKIFLGWRKCASALSPHLVIGCWLRLPLRLMSDAGRVEPEVGGQGLWLWGEELWLLLDVTPLQQLLSNPAQELKTSLKITYYRLL